MRRRKAGSVSTKACVRTITSSTSRLAATGAKAMPSDSNSGCSANGRFSGLKAPASSLEMSSSASSSDSTAPRLASILPPRSLSGSRSIIAAVNSRAACSGCSRSWLAAAMNRVLPRLAASASARLASSSAVRAATRCSRVSAARRSWRSLSRRASAVRTRAVTSLQVATKPPLGSGSSRSSTTQAVRRADFVRPRRVGPPQQRMVERQQRGEAVVGDLEPAVLVEGGDAHADMVEAVAQDVVVVADRLRRLVDQRAGAARQQPAAAAEGADDHPRRSRAQGARQHALGLRQRRRQRHRLAPSARSRPFGTDEAGQQLAQLGKPLGVGRRRAGRRLGLGAEHEGVGLLGIGAAARTSSDTPTSSSVLTRMPTHEALPHRIEFDANGAGSQSCSGAAGPARGRPAGWAAAAHRARPRSRRPGPRPRRSDERAASRGRAPGPARSWRRRRS